MRVIDSSMSLHKTCEIIITDAQFTSNITKKSYFTRNYDDLNFKSIII